MRRVPAYALAIATGAVFTTANAQFTSVKPLPSKTSVTSATGGASGGFLMGTDSCVGAHTNAGTGDVAGVPFTNGTTGTQGQNEALCLAFSTTGVDNDVWFDWTANATGNASVSTCSGTTTDTKVAVYPGTPGACPANGTALACNDDACGLQSTATFAATSGSTYTIQVGTFPGAAPGAGTFDVTQTLPPPCGVYDDGTTENALGLTAGGETGWLHNQECLMTVERVETAYGTPLGTSVPNGTASTIAVYEDADCDRLPTTPAGGPTLVWSLATTVTNSATDILNNYPAPVGANTLIASRCSWVMATANQVAGEFPAPMDQTNPTPKAWVVGSTLGANTLDEANLNNNNVAPTQIQAIGFPAAWLLRASGQESSGNPHTPVCFGATACPCGNNGDGTGGCNNSVGTGGAVLAGSGVASLNNDSLALTATRTTNQPGIFFQGNIELPNPPLFGDGIRCCGNSVIRCGTWLPAGNTTNTDTGNNIGGNSPPISDIGANATTLMAGDSRCYQWWYRDPAGPCGGSFNLSNAVLVNWLP